MLKWLSTLLTIAESGGLTPPESLFGWEKLTLVGFLLALVWAIMTKKLVPGSFYEELKKENERLRMELEAYQRLGMIATETAEKVASKKPVSGGHAG